MRGAKQTIKDYCPKEEWPGYAERIESKANKIVAAGSLCSLGISIPQLIIYLSITGILANAFLSTPADDSFISDLRIFFALTCIGQIYEGLRNVYSSAIYGDQNAWLPLLCAIVFVLAGGVGLSAASLEIGWKLYGVAGSGAGMLIFCFTALCLWWHGKQINHLAHSGLTQDLELEDKLEDAPAPEGKSCIPWKYFSKCNPKKFLNLEKEDETLLLQNQSQKPDSNYKTFGNK